MSTFSKVLIGIAATTAALALVAMIAGICMAEDDYYDDCEDDCGCGGCDRNLDDSTMFEGVPDEGDYDDDNELDDESRGEDDA